MKKLKEYADIFAQALVLGAGIAAGMLIIVAVSKLF